MMTTTDEVVGRLGEDFLAQAFRREHQVFPKAVSAPAELLSWQTLNTILATQRLDPPRLRLSRDGVTLRQEEYSTTVVGRRNVLWQRLATAELHRRLREDATLVVDAIDEIHPPIGELAAALERHFRTGVQVNAYASFRPESGFQTHWDDHDTVIVQVIGVKRWQVFGPTRINPLFLDVETGPEPTGDPIAEFVLAPGDVLYVPRGHWHNVTASEGVPSLHLTCGLRVTTGADLVAWLGETLRVSETFRADLPTQAGPAEQAEYLGRWHEGLLAELGREDLLERFLAERDGMDPGRLGPSLPLVDGVPADPAITVRMLTPRVRVRDEEDMVLVAAGGQEWMFGAGARPVMNLLATGQTFILRQLAAESGLAVAAVAKLVAELLSNQVVQVGAAR